MKLTAKDALDMYRINPKTVAKNYLEHINVRIEGQSEFRRNSIFTGLIDDKTGDVSFFFETAYSRTRINFDATEIIFNELTKHGYDIHTNFKITSDNKYEGSCYLGEIEINWSTADANKFSIKPDEIKMITAKQAFDNFYDKLLVRDQFITEVIVPKIEEVAREETFIELAGVDLWYQGCSIRFPKEYNKYGYDIDLTKLILDELRKNGFHCQFEVETSGTEYRDGVSTLVIRWDEN